MKSEEYHEVGNAHSSKSQVCRLIEKFIQEDPSIHETRPSRLVTAGRIILDWGLVSEITNRIAARNFEFQVFFEHRRAYSPQWL